MDLLETLRSKGYRIVYSDDVVTPAMRALERDEVPIDLDLVRGELARHGLVLKELEAGVYIVVRRAAPEGQESRQVFSSLLEEIVVTPDRFDIAGEGFEQQRQVRADDLKLAPLRLGETMSLVESIPGVAIGSEEAAPRIRGSSGQDVMVVMDGFELYEPYHLPDFRSPLSLVDPEDVETLEVHTGGLSVAYGDRLGGLVRIETPATLPAETHAVDIGTASSRLSWSGALPRDGLWAASARAWYPNEVVEAVNVGDDDVSPNLADFFAKVQFQPSPRHRLSIHALGARDTIDYTAVEQDESADAEVGSSFLWARWGAHWSEAMTSETVLGVGHVSRERLGWAIAEDERETQVRDRRSTTFLSLAQRLSLQLGTRHVLAMGYDARRLRADYDYASSTSGEGRGEQVRFEAELAGTSIAAYVSDRIRLWPKFVVELGARWDLQNYNDERQLSPRINLAWRLAEHHVVRVSAGRYAQSQRIHELEVQDGITEFSRAQISDQVSASWEGETPSGVRFRFGGYARWLKHLRPRFENLYSPVELFPEVEADRVRIDADRARSRGLELSLESPLRYKKVHGSFSYTLSRVEDREDGRWVPRSWDQRHAASASLIFQLNSRSNFSLAAVARTGWPTTPPPAGQEALRKELPPGSRNSVRLGAYYRLDVRYSHFFVLPKARLRLDLGVTNLTNRRNECCTDVGVDAASGEVFSETKYWVGIAPVLNLSWRF